ncbi:MAG: family 78 glycoside hydrolase catalytic domain [Clostridia bacterium]|nr:family 78 glycoside hydrolase catalytic domain [Clostridia bacterium]
MMSAPFSLVNFIKAPGKFDPHVDGGAPMFRRCFSVSEPVQSAFVRVCGLGYAYYYLNGKPISDDLFTAPVSDYRKTLWYQTYDVTDLILEGGNSFAVICGNGWYNEYFKTSWDHDIAPWRDSPKFILELYVNGKRILTSDSTWKCFTDGPVIYNQLRSGEHFDARKYDPAWVTAAFDDSAWGYAAFDTTPPTGIFRLCECEPIQADRIYPAVQMFDRGNQRYIFDLGQNMSGFVRLTVDGSQEAGDELIIRYGEKLDENGDLNTFHMENHYRESVFAEDRLICSGKPLVWSPRFAYHGFRFIEVTGLKNPTLDSVSGVFVHQAVEKRSCFTCSDDFLNRIFHAGQMATWSNLFYMPTDCPTREKLGWCNDAQASCEQMLTNFKTERLFTKWLQDLFDAQLPDGRMPGIVPSSGWGYIWGNGPVSDGVLFEVPYRLYLHTGNPKPLIDALPYFDRYLEFLAAQENENGDITFGLDDWAAPDWNDKVNAAFINSVYRVKFARIALLAAQLSGVDTTTYEEQLSLRIAAHKAKYLLPDGTCSIPKQTAAAMMIYHHIYDTLAPLAAQLARLVEEKAFHHDCGMVGLRHLYMALNQCGLQDYAYKIITASDFPSYRNWDEDGMTTLYEMWHMLDSHNHHMYSDFMSWMMKTIIGIRPTAPAYQEVSIEPCFFDGLTYAAGAIDIPGGGGRISVDWKRNGQTVSVTVGIPAGIKAVFQGKALSEGIQTFTV